jgi:hypothetical protein
VIPAESAQGEPVSHYRTTRNTHAPVAGPTLARPEHYDDGVVWGPPGRPGPPPGGTPGPGGPHGSGRADPHAQPTWPAIPLPAPCTPSPPEPPGPDREPFTDPFQQAEHDTRATVAAPWWPLAPPVHRQQALTPRLVGLPDHTWWMYGAWAHWYRRHPADGRWFPCPPPRATRTRRSAFSPHQGFVPPAIPAELLPTGPDFAHDFGTPLAVAGTPVSGAALYRLRQIIAEAALAPPGDHPLGWSHFLHGTPSTVAATWSTMLWCAAVPLFDSDADAHLLGLWQPYLAHPLTGTGRLRWLVAPPLRTIIGLYAERLHAGQPDAAGQITRCMAMIAQALRDDPRFQVRATALLAMLEPIQRAPAVDLHALGYGEQAVEREWIKRCPAPLLSAVFGDTAPGESFQFAFYDLAVAVAPLCGDPDDTGLVEPRHAATALIAADMAGYRPDLAGPAAAWLDPELRGLLLSVLEQPEHRLRRLWPHHGRMPEGLRPASASAALDVLSATAALDFAWCRLAKGIPIPPDGFTVPEALAVVLDEPPAPAEAEVPAEPSVPGDPPVPPRETDRPDTGPIKIS